MKEITKTKKKQNTVSDFCLIHNITEYEKQPLT